MTCYLADINIWIAIASSAHVRHALARAWFHSLQHNQVWFCRFTQMGFLRLLTNQAVMGNRPLTQVQAWSVLDQFAANARVGYLDEPSGVAEVFRSLTRRDRPATNTWSDAYIAAVSLQAGMVVATMDQDFLDVGAPSLVLS